MNKRKRGKLRKMERVPSYFLGFIQQIPYYERTKTQRKMIKSGKFR